MPNPIRTDLHTVDSSSFPYVYEQNATVALKSSDGLVRCNVYRPHGSGPDARVPVLVTYGPYGKDAYYGDQSRTQVHHSAWETPDPGFWTNHGYAVVRADERGIGQSRGLLDTMSRGTSEAFFEVVEWCAEQPWSSGKVGLLGISYYAGSQWRVAARKPKGLAAMIPWEGMSDYYRDRCRHGGILSNNFIKFWWNRQVVSNQYGRPRDEEILVIKDLVGDGPKRPKSSPESLEGNLSAEEREQNRRDQTVDNQLYRFRDEEYYASKEYDLGDIDVPLLSVANWGGILLHLRGNMEGYAHAGSAQKWLRVITGRHDLPFYYKEEVEVQRSFLDAFLKAEDRDGWTTGKAHGNRVAHRADGVDEILPHAGKATHPRSGASPKRQPTPPKAHVRGARHAGKPQLVQFQTEPFEAETEVTGNIVAHLLVSATPQPDGPTPSEIDLFLTLRHISAEGKEVFYTGTAGDAVPLTKGWLRVSLRKVATTHPKHREAPSKLQGFNHICFGPDRMNYITLPVIPPKAE
ncbi:unnamed protein product [Parascedosporium putredinis]|uniref:Xaa-Pro dipeptidyl-peptidase C-terminal domain-containing protein n=1 Tax=Parascedosporium putredinis TaxID=1442378 RepID=A0A9P1GYJ6_9PEZI|nr:unnamed protein product [Parascedosporium putredinis]CAI7990801.1 unnamed protein product [Parascedosporium putredinis]